VTAGGRLACLCTLLVVALAVGCARPAATTPENKSAKSTNPGSGDLTLAVDALRKLAEGAEDQPLQRTIFYLNQWLASSDAAKAPWSEDRLLDNLPRALRITPGLERLGKLQFSTDDIVYLQQTLWLHDIASRAAKERSPASLTPWLKEIESSIGLPEAEQLATAERLFDWTIRNLQLDPLPPPPKQREATAGSKNADPVAPAMEGEVGPGYGHVPFQLLLFGRGDAHERARIFILLCRQMGIDAVMLGIKEKDAPLPRAWTPAILVAGQLYLFEPGLGLPIPGPGGKGIATLDQLVADPKLLRQLDVEGLPPYPVAENDLSSIVALVDAEPAALSRRMQLLQAALPAGSRYALAIQARPLAVKLQPSKLDVSLWRVPFEALLYQIGQQQALARDPNAAREFSVQSAIFAPERPLMKARNLHLQGRYQNEEQKKGARALYLECRPPDAEMDKMLSSDYFRKLVGLDQALPQDPAQRQALIEHFVAIARAGKFNATYWLGLTYYEAGNYATAIEWLGERTLEVFPPGPWIPGARYNLARCYEQLGQAELARKWLESDKDSPQRHGNLLRARRMAVAADVAAAP
jgi:tetratricopeptide (TPR) repeat protein